MNGLTRLIRLAWLTDRPLGALAGLVAWRLTGKGRRINTYRLGQVRLYARAIDQFGIEEVFLEGEYGFLEPVLKMIERPVVIDAGANVGAFAAWVFAVAPGATVISIEAAPDTSDLLRRTVAANPSFRWRALHSAVWVEDGTIRFDGAAALSTARRISSSGEAVPAMTLRSVMRMSEAGPVALLKMDIEGAEAAVLADAARELEEIGAVVVEVHPPAVSVANVRDALRRAFPLVIEHGARRSRKPLLVAAREPYANVLREVLAR